MLFEEVYEASGGADEDVYAFGELLFLLFVAGAAVN